MKITVSKKVVEIVMIIVLSLIGIYFMEEVWCEEISALIWSVMIVAVATICKGGDSKEEKKD